MTERRRPLGPSRHADLLGMGMDTQTMLFAGCLLMLVTLSNADPSTLGCYYNYNHYSEGDRILTNEPCLNCTCHNKMLMCYLRVCPFTKPIGQDCVIEKREDQCCPIITCPEVAVELIEHASDSASTSLVPADRFGCSIDSRFYPEGAQIPSNPRKPCELCYCIRNMTSCVMQECTLHVDGCRPIYNKGVCCPVRYDCGHDAIDESMLLEDGNAVTTERPSEGFLITTTEEPALQAKHCTHNGERVLDGALLERDNQCQRCYCMKGDIVCAMMDCGLPLEQEGQNCTALPVKSGQCCPEYACVSSALEAGIDVTTLAAAEEDEASAQATPLPTFLTDEAEDSASTEPSAAEEQHKETAAVTEDTINEEMTEATEAAATEMPAIHEDLGLQQHIDDVTDATLAATQTPLTVAHDDETATAAVGGLNNRDADVDVSTAATAATPTEKIDEDDSLNTIIPHTIPGEGDCNVEGVRYLKNTAVPLHNKCRSACFCVNSIVQCDPCEQATPLEEAVLATEAAAAAAAEDKDAEVTTVEVEKHVEAATTETVISEAEEPNTQEPEHETVAVTELSVEPESTEKSTDNQDASQEPQEPHNVTELIEPATVPEETATETAADDVEESTATVASDTSSIDEDNASIATEASITSDENVQSTETSAPVEPAQLPEQVTELAEEFVHKGTVESITEITNFVEELVPAVTEHDEASGDSLPIDEEPKEPELASTDATLLSTDDQDIEHDIAQATEATVEDLQPIAEVSTEKTADEMVPAVSTDAEGIVAAAVTVKIEIDETAAATDASIAAEPQSTEETIKEIDYVTVASSIPEFIEPSQPDVIEQDQTTAPEEDIAAAEGTTATPALDNRDADVEVSSPEQKPIEVLTEADLITEAVKDTADEIASATPSIVDEQLTGESDLSTAAPTSDEVEPEFQAVTVVTTETAKVVEPEVEVTSAAAPIEPAQDVTASSVEDDVESTEAATEAAAVSDAEEPASTQEPISVHADEVTEADVQSEGDAATVTSISADEHKPVEPEVIADEVTEKNAEKPEQEQTLTVEETTPVVSDVSDVEPIENVETVTEAAHEPTDVETELNTAAPAAPESVPVQEVTVQEHKPAEEPEVVEHRLDASTVAPIADESASSSAAPSSDAVDVEPLAEVDEQTDAPSVMIVHEEEDQHTTQPPQEDNLVREPTAVTEAAVVEEDVKMTESNVLPAVEVIATDVPAVIVNEVAITEATVVEHKDIIEPEFIAPSSTDESHKAEENPVTESAVKVESAVEVSTDHVEIIEPEQITEATVQSIEDVEPTVQVTEAVPEIFSAEVSTETVVADEIVTVSSVEDIEATSTEEAAEEADVQQPIEPAVTVQTIADVAAADEKTESSIVPDVAIEPVAVTEEAVKDAVTEVVADELATETNIAAQSPTIASEATTDTPVVEADEPQTTEANLLDERFEDLNREKPAVSTEGAATPAEIATEASVADKIIPIEISTETIAAVADESTEEQTKDEPITETSAVDHAAGSGDDDIDISEGSGADLPVEHIPIDTHIEGSADVEAASPEEVATEAAVHIAGDEDGAEGSGADLPVQTPTVDESPVEGSADFAVEPLEANEPVKISTESTVSSDDGSDVQSTEASVTVPSDEVVDDITIDAVVEEDVQKHEEPVEPVVAVTETPAVEDAIVTEAVEEIAPAHKDVDLTTVAPAKEVSEATETAAKDEIIPEVATEQADIEEVSTTEPAKIPAAVDESAEISTDSVPLVVVTEVADEAAAAVTEAAVEKEEVATTEQVSDVEPQAVTEATLDEEHNDIETATAAAADSVEPEQSTVTISEIPDKTAHEVPATEAAAQDLATEAPEAVPASVEKSEETGTPAEPNIEENVSHSDEAAPVEISTEAFVVNELPEATEVSIPAAAQGEDQVQVTEAAAVDTSFEATESSVEADETSAVVTEANVLTFAAENHTEQIEAVTDEITSQEAEHKPAVIVEDVVQSTETTVDETPAIEIATASVPTEPAAEPADATAEDESDQTTPAAVQTIDEEIAPQASEQTPAADVSDVAEDKVEGSTYVPIDDFVDTATDAAPQFDVAAVTDATSVADVDEVVASATDAALVADVDEAVSPVTDGAPVANVDEVVAVVTDAALSENEQSATDSPALIEPAVHSDEVTVSADVATEAAIVHDIEEDAVSTNAPVSSVVTNDLTTDAAPVEEHTVEADIATDATPAEKDEDAVSVTETTNVSPQTVEDGVSATETAFEEDKLIILDDLTTDAPAAETPEAPIAPSTAQEPIETDVQTIEEHTEQDIETADIDATTLSSVEPAIVAPVDHNEVAPVEDEITNTEPAIAAEPIDPAVETAADPETVTEKDEEVFEVASATDSAPFAGVEDDEAQQTVTEAAAETPVVSDDVEASSAVPSLPAEEVADDLTTVEPDVLSQDAAPTATEAAAEPTVEIADVAIDAATEADAAAVQPIEAVESATEEATGSLDNRIDEQTSVAPAAEPVEIITPTEAAISAHSEDVEIVTPTEAFVVDVTTEYVAIVVPEILIEEEPAKMAAEDETSTELQGSERDEPITAAAIPEPTTTTTTTAAPTTTTTTTTTTTAAPTTTTTTTETPSRIDDYTHTPIYEPATSTSFYPAAASPQQPAQPSPGYPSASAYPEDDYTDEEDPTAFGPGTCRYGGKLYVSAQQIPRDDPCDFCFCFRSDIICLQQSCPPPINGCHEEPIHGFCCPRYECPVSMATVMNVTLDTTTTTTTLPPLFQHHAYGGAAVKSGCQIQGRSYQVGEVVQASSGPCMHCVCGGDGQMQCDPKACAPEPMMRQMIAIAASRR